MIGFLMVFVFSNLLACAAVNTQPERAKFAIESQGYKNVKMLGYSFWGCTLFDGYKDKFQAIAPNGTCIEGVVCGGPGLGSVVKIMGPCKKDK